MSQFVSQETQTLNLSNIKDREVAGRAPKKLNKKHFDSYIQWFEFIEDSAMVKSRNKG